ncbi:MAG: hypothetical protein ACKOFW_14505, partial [Planctomycetaceae bacterium]
MGLEAFRFPFQLRAHRFEATRDELPRWQRLPKLRSSEWPAASWSATRAPGSATRSTAGAPRASGTAAEGAAVASFLAFRNRCLLRFQQWLEPVFQFIQPGEEPLF